MQTAITCMTVIAGLIFSLAVTAIAEELIFGQVFRLLLAPAKLGPQAGHVKPERER